MFKKFKEWILDNIATSQEIELIDKESLDSVKQQRKKLAGISKINELKELINIFNSVYSKPQLLKFQIGLRILISHQCMGCLEEIIYLKLEIY